MLSEFKKAVISLSDSIDSAIKHKIDLQKKSSIKALYDFKVKRDEYLQKNLENSFKNFRAKSFALTGMHDKKAEPIITSIVGLVGMLDDYYKHKNLEGMREAIWQIKELADELPEMPEIKQKNTENIENIQFQFNLKIPEEIKDEIKTDIEEMQKCFNSKCYRSAIILCGRILETALHRKYYNVTKKDLLETSPGIGLGNLIAKLTEAKVELDPGLTQQIHLVNQLRVYSVHKKQIAFRPSKEQAQAMILYTLDVLKKLF